MTDHSEDIGYLKAKAESAQNQLTSLFEKNDEQTEMIGKIHTLLESHVTQSQLQHQGIREEVDEIKEEVEDCQVGVQEFRTVKRAAIWVTGIFAIIWSGLIKAVDFIIGS